jgi:hypothetical protein
MNGPADGPARVSAATPPPLPAGEDRVDTLSRRAPMLSINGLLPAARMPMPRTLPERGAYRGIFGQSSSPPSGEMAWPRDRDAERHSILHAIWGRALQTDSISRNAAMRTFPATKAWLGLHILSLSERAGARSPPATESSCVTRSSAVHGTSDILPASAATCDRTAVSKRGYAY